MYDDEYYDQDGHQYHEQVGLLESYHVGLISKLQDVLDNDDYPAEIIADSLESSFHKRGYTLVSNELINKLLTDI
jgi:hypothetical protein